MRLILVAVALVLSACSSTSRNIASDKNTGMTREQYEQSFAMGAGYAAALQATGDKMKNKTKVEDEFYCKTSTLISRALTPAQNMGTKQPELYNCTTSSYGYRCVVQNSEFGFLNTRSLDCHMKGQIEVCKISFNNINDDEIDTAEATIEFKRNPKTSQIQTASNTYTCTHKKD